MGMAAPALETHLQDCLQDLGIVNHEANHGVLSGQCMSLDKGWLRSSESILMLDAGIKSSLRQMFL